MKKVGQLVQNLGLNDIREAAHDGYNRNRRDYTGSRNISKPKYARFKLKVKFTDSGKERVFYSLDTLIHQGRVLRDEWKGYSDLMDKVAKWALTQKIWWAKIYMNIEDQLPKTEDPHYNIRTYNGWINANGHWVTKDEQNRSFTLIGDHNILKIDEQA